MPFYLVSQVRTALVTVNGEVQCEGHDVRHWGDDTQHHSVQQLEGQHGVHREDDEEEERHLQEKIGDKQVVFFFKKKQEGLFL